MSELNLIKEKDIIMYDNIICMTAESIGRALGYATPKQSIYKIYNRNQEELDNYSTIVKMTTVDGKAREVRVFSEEGIYIISMLANTDKAKAFRRELANLLKQKRLEALKKEKIAGFEISEKLNKRFRNLKLDTADIESIKLLLNIGFAKKGIGKMFNISADSVRRIEKDFISAGILSAANS